MRKWQFPQHIPFSTYFILVYKLRVQYEVIVATHPPTKWTSRKICAEYQPHGKWQDLFCNTEHWEQKLGTRVAKRWSKKKKKFTYIFFALLSLAEGSIHSVLARMLMLLQQQFPPP